jgi:hypothetical protein
MRNLLLASALLVGISLARPAAAEAGSSFFFSFAQPGFGIAVGAPTAPYYYPPPAYYYPPAPVVYAPPIVYGGYYGYYGHRHHSHGHGGHAWGRGYRSRGHRWR